MARSRYIPYPELLAAALAQILPEAMRNDLRRRKVSAEEVIGQFNRHHIRKHADDNVPDDEVNKWHNLHWFTEADHRDQEASLNDRKYTRAIKRGNRELTRSTARPSAPKRQWPSRKLPSRPFPKRQS
jgi:hypothetical protein